MDSADEKYMREALREARAAFEEGEVPIGAVVVCRGRTVGKGHNMTELLHDPTAHAEMIALTAATEALGGKYLSDCTIYVTVAPCPMCAAALAWAQVGRIVWGSDDPKRGYSLFTAPAVSPGSPCSPASEGPGSSCPSGSAVTNVAGGPVPGAPDRRSLLHPKTVVERGVLAAESASLMADFFKARRK